MSLLLNHRNLLRSAAMLVAVIVVFTAGARAQANREAPAPVVTRSIEVDGSSLNWGQATILLDQPIDKVATVLTDYNNYYTFMPHFKKSKVLSRRGNRALVYMEVGVLKNTVTLWGQLKIAETPPQGTTRTFDASLIEGNLKEFSARFILRPSADGKTTSIEFQIRVDPDLPLPTSIYNRENEKAAGKTLRALRERIADPRSGA